MTTWRVTMVPDTSGWAEDDLSWETGFQDGLRQDFEDEAGALKQAETVTALGWSAAVEKLEDERAG